MAFGILAEGIEIVSKEAFAILLFLLPGFIAAWVFYGITAHPKKETFERLVQALIFTMFIKAMNILARKFWWMWWHPSHPDGKWNDDKEVIWSVINSVLLGLVVAVLANWDLAHIILRFIKITRRTAFPSEWYSAFHRYRRDVVLYLKDDRRVRAWAEEYPDQSDKGHFLLQRILWLDEEGNETPQETVESTLLPAEDVRMVQFIKNPPMRTFRHKLRRRCRWFIRWARLQLRTWLCDETLSVSRRKRQRKGSGYG